MAFVTGNNPNLHPDFDDVDEGSTVLSSPSMDLTGYSNPHFNFARTFYCDYGPNLIDDTLKIYASNGTNTVLIDQIVAPQGAPATWEMKSVSLNGLLPITSSMQIVVRISDEDPNFNVTEASFDYFSVTNNNVSALPNIEKSPLMAYPNPSTGLISVQGISPNEVLSVFDIRGVLVLKVIPNSDNYTLDLSAFSGSVFMLKNGSNTLRILKY